MRHGETEWSRDKKHTGRADIDLTTAGEQQARELACCLGGDHPALVLSSPRSRTLRTAELAGLTDVVTDQDLAEWDYGDFEGRTTAEIREELPQWTIWTGEVPGGERIDQVAKRADRVLARIIDAIADGDVIVVGHGHFNRILAARWIEMPAVVGQHLWLDTGTICELGFEHDHRAIKRWNLPPSAAGSVL